MRMVIIGAGSAGSKLAAKLCDMNHDVVLVDEQQAPLDEAAARFDILTVCGSGASPSVLRSAEIERAGMLLAVTDRDEVNVLACALAADAGVPLKVARLSDPGWTDIGQDVARRMGVDLGISHKEVCARELSSILHMPGAMETVDLLDGRLMLLGIRIREGSPLLTGSLKDFAEEPVFATTRFIAQARPEHVLIPSGETQFKLRDEAYVVTRPEHAGPLLDWISPARPDIDHIVIAGGGDLGLGLAQLLDGDKCKVVLIEQDPARAQHCSDVLEKALVLQEDVSNQESLAKANIGKHTAFLSLTGEDELNIISCLVASRMGAVHTSAQIGKPEYVPIIRSLGLIDRAVSPHLSMINAILHFARAKHVTGAALLHRLPGEMLEVTVPKRNKWVDLAIRRIRLPHGAIIASFLRGDDVSVPTGDDVIRVGDRLAIFALPEAVAKTEALFK